MCSKPRAHKNLPSVLQQLLTFSKPGGENDKQASRSTGLGQAVVLGRNLIPRYSGPLAVGLANELGVWAADRKWQVSRVAVGKYIFLSSIQEHLTTREILHIMSSI